MLMFDQDTMVDLCILSFIYQPDTQEAYTGEIIQERRSFKATFEAVTSPRRK